jgi:hypothetical protein
VAELRVPEIVEDQFREHFRALILGSVLRAAEERSERHRARGHRLRARRAERTLQRLRSPVQTPIVVVPAPPREPPVPEPVVLPPPVEAPVSTSARVPRTEYVPLFGTTIRRTAAVVWFATLAALVANVVVLGFDSYATAAADLGLIAMTFVWFSACIDDLIAPR